VTGNPSDRFTVIEVAYSIGLAAGIIIFYNHIGGKRLTSDPTPLEVEMRNYESDVNKAIIVMADREKLEKDVK
jgi:stage V sporulation protein AA